MSTSSLATSRFRTTAVVVLLVVTAVFAVIALSQLFIGIPGDPRDTMGARAAGIGFTDHAHTTLFGAIPLALPLVAALISDQPGVRLLSAVAYGVLIATGLLISISAFAFGLDLAETQADAGVTPPWIDTRSAVEFLITDLATLVLALVAMVFCLNSWRRARPPADL